MIHIYGHTWPIRWGKPEEMKEILVYSNCPQVELIVNGVPQGIKKRNSQDYPAAGLHWNCKLQAGREYSHRPFQRESSRGRHAPVCIRNPHMG